MTLNNMSKFPRYGWIFPCKFCSHPTMYIHPEFDDNILPSQYICRVCNKKQSKIKQKWIKISNRIYASE